MGERSHCNGVRLLGGCVALAWGCAQSQSTPRVAAPPAVAESERASAVPQTLPDLPSSAESAPEPSSEAPGWLGVAMRDREPSQPGVTIVRVLRGSPAAKAGILVGDIVLAVNGQAVAASEELSLQISKLGQGTRALLAVERGGQHKILAAPLIGVPGAQAQLTMGFVGMPAPDFEGLLVAQGSITEHLSELRGQVVVLEFWASWCAACRALMPTLNAWHENMAPLGGQVVSITLDPLEKAARDAFQLGIRYPVLADPEGRTTRLYQAMALPTLFLVDRKGVVRHIMVGYGPQQIEQLGANLEQLLSES